MTQNISTNEMMEPVRIEQARITTEFFDDFIKKIQTISTDAKNEAIKLVNSKVYDENPDEYDYSEYPLLSEYLTNYLSITGLPSTYMHTIPKKQFEYETSGGREKLDEELKSRGIPKYSSEYKNFKNDARNLRNRQEYGDEVYYVFSNTKRNSCGFIINNSRAIFNCFKIEATVGERVILTYAPSELLKNMRRILTDRVALYSIDLKSDQKHANCFWEIPNIVIPRSYIDLLKWFSENYQKRDCIPPGLIKYFSDTSRLHTYDQMYKKYHEMKEQHETWAVEKEIESNFIEETKTMLAERMEMIDQEKAMFETDTTARYEEKYAEMKQKINVMKVRNKRLQKIIDRYESLSDSSECDDVLSPDDVNDSD